MHFFMLYTWDRGVNAGLGSLVLWSNVYFLSIHPMKWGLVLAFLVGKLR